MTQQDTGVVAEAAAPRRDGVGWPRWIWRQLTSMRTALILLFLLALASIPGSVLPQRGTNPIRVNAWIADNPTAGPILGALLAVGIAFVLRGSGGGQTDSVAAQGVLHTQVRHPERA